MKEVGEDGYQGAECPECASDQLDYDNFDFESGKVWQRVMCLDCEATWDDIYTFTHWLPVSSPSGKEELRDRRANGKAG
jgi:hypothetical protein